MHETLFKIAVTKALYFIIIYIAYKMTNAEYNAFGSSLTDAQKALIEAMNA